MRRGKKKVSRASGACSDCAWNFSSDSGAWYNSLSGTRDDECDGCDYGKPEMLQNHSISGGRIVTTLYTLDWWMDTKSVLLA